MNHTASAHDASDRGRRVPKSAAPVPLDEQGDDLVERLLLMADQGDFGRKPDPTDIRRRAAARIQADAAEKAKLREALEEARRVLNETPELNMSNYNEDDVSALNAGMIEVYTILDRAALNPTTPEARHV